MSVLKFLSVLLSVLHRAHAAETMDLGIASLSWNVVNDSVMGGKSYSTATVVGDSLSFSGFVNINGGGFVSARSYVDAEMLAGALGLKIRATLQKGDNRIYKTSLESGWYSFQADMTFTKLGEEQEFTLPFSEFVPNFRGMVMSGAGIGEADLLNVDGIGFMLSYITMWGKKIPGFKSEAFELTVSSMELMFDAPKANPMIATLACEAYSEAACREAAKAAGLRIGGAGYPFSGSWSNASGCYAYSSGMYMGIAYYSNWGNKADQALALSGDMFRPAGYDCEAEACEPYSQAACKTAALKDGLGIGGAGYPFVGSWSNAKGCYAYSDGPFKGNTYYSMGGSMTDRAMTLSGSMYRPFGHDCESERTTGTKVTMPAQEGESELPECSSTRPGGTGFDRDYRILKVPEAWAEDPTEEAIMAANQLCCVYTRVEAWSESDLALEAYDGSVSRFSSDAGMVASAGAVLANICSMSMGSMDCADQAMCIAGGAVPTSKSDALKPGVGCGKTLERRACGLREGCKFKKESGCMQDKRWRKALKTTCRKIAKSKEADCGAPESGCKAKEGKSNKKKRKVKCVPDL